MALEIRSEIDQSDGRFTVLSVHLNYLKAINAHRTAKAQYQHNKPILRKIGNEWAILRKLPQPVGDYFFR